MKLKFIYGIARQLYVVINAGGDYAYEQLGVDGRQIKTQVLKEYWNYHEI